MDGGRFEITDVSGMMPDQEEIRRQAELLAREMYPEKFGLESRVESEVTIREGVVDDPLLRDDEFAERVTGEMERAMGAYAPRSARYWLDPDKPTPSSPTVTEVADTSPLTRLFNAVRAIITSYDAQDTAESDPCLDSEINELKAAFDNLKLE